MQQGRGKAAQIRKLYAEGKSIKEIAAIIGCRDSYVRICARQRVLPGGWSQSDINWVTKTYGGLREYRLARNKIYREYRSQYYKRRWREDMQFRARREENIRAYRERKKRAREVLGVVRADPPGCGDSR